MEVDKNNSSDEECKGDKVEKGAIDPAKPPRLHPQQNTFQLEGGMIFDSCFDSGNLAKAEKIGENLIHLWITSDNAGTQFEKSYRTWFHFSVSGFTPGKTYRFVIKNMNLQMKMFREGMAPVFKNFPSTNDWRRIQSPVTNMVQTEQAFEFEFQHKFETGDKDVRFAFTYPYSYEDTENYVTECENIARSRPDIYFNRELLIFSKEKRRVELLTISSMSDISTERETSFYTLFPEKELKPRPFIFRGKKKYVFLSARVHPGEIPASYVLKGIMDFILHPTDPRAQVLRDNFVFVIIPLLNPDGVYRGNYRTDTMGQNLNRFYAKPSVIDQPSIFGAREILVNLKFDNRLFLYLDLHAHATKKGCFIFGNHLDFREQVNTCLFSKLISLNSEHFDYENCDFSEKNMYSKDKSDGLSKEGSGRVSIYKTTNLLHCYTLECNYNMGRVVNIIPNPVDSSEERKVAEELPTLLQLNGFKIDSNPTPPFYTPKSYEQIGEGICLSLLDYFNINPMSRIPNCALKTLNNLKLHMAVNIMKQMPYRLESWIRTANKNLEANLDAVLQFVDKGVKKEIKEEKKPATTTKRTGVRTAAKISTITIGLDGEKDSLMKK